MSQGVGYDTPGYVKCNDLLARTSAVLCGNTYPTTLGSNGQVIGTNGSGTLTWVNKGNGTVTSITAGTNLNAVASNPIVGSGTINLNASLVTMSDINSSAATNNNTTNCLILDSLSSSIAGTNSYSTIISSNTGAISSTGIYNTLMSTITGAISGSGSYNSIIGSISGTISSTGSYNLITAGYGTITGSTTQSAIIASSNSTAGCTINSGSSSYSSVILATQGNSTITNSLGSLIGCSLSSNMTSGVRSVILGSNDCTMSVAGIGRIMLASDSITDASISTDNTIFGGTASTVRWQIQSGTGNATFTGVATLGGNAYPTVTGTNGQVLTTDGAGTLSWGTNGITNLASAVTTSIASGTTTNVTLTPDPITTTGTISLPTNIGNISSINKGNAASNFCIDIHGNNNTTSAINQTQCAVLDSNSCTMNSKGFNNTLIGCTNLTFDGSASTANTVRNNLFAASSFSVAAALTIGTYQCSTNTWLSCITSGLADAGTLTGNLAGSIVAASSDSCVKQGLSNAIIAGTGSIIDATLGRSCVIIGTLGGQITGGTYQVILNANNAVISSSGSNNTITASGPVTISGATSGCIISSALNAGNEISNGTGHSIISVSGTCTISGAGTCNSIHSGNANSIASDGNYCSVIGSSNTTLTATGTSDVVIGSDSVSIDGTGATSNQRNTFISCMATGGPGILTTGANDCYSNAWIAVDGATNFGTLAGNLILSLVAATSTSAITRGTMCSIIGSATSTISSAAGVSNTILGTASGTISGGSTHLIASSSSSTVSSAGNYCSIIGSSSGTINAGSNHAIIASSSAPLTISSSGANCAIIASQGGSGTISSGSCNLIAAAGAGGGNTVIIGGSNSIMLGVTAQTTLNGTGSSNGIICSSVSTLANVGSYNTTLSVTACSINATSTTECNNNLLGASRNNSGVSSVVTGANACNGNTWLSCYRTTAGDIATLTGDLTRSAQIASQDSKINRGNNLVILGCNGSSITVTSGQSSVMIGCNAGSITGGTYNGIYSGSGSITSSGSSNFIIGSTSSCTIIGSTSNTSLISCANTVNSAGGRNVCIAVTSSGISSSSSGNVIMAANAPSIAGTSSNSAIIAGDATGGGLTVNAGSSNGMIACQGNCNMTGTTLGSLVTASTGANITAGSNSAIIGSTTCLLTAGLQNNTIVASALSSITATGGTAYGNLIAACFNTLATAVVTGANQCSGNTWLSCINAGDIATLTGTLSNSFQAGSQDSKINQGNNLAIIGCNGSSITVTSGQSSVMIGSNAGSITAGTYNGVYSSNAATMSSVGAYNFMLGSSSNTLSTTGSNCGFIAASNGTISAGSGHAIIASSQSPLTISSTGSNCCIIASNGGPGTIGGTGSCNLMGACNFAGGNISMTGAGSNCVMLGVYATTTFNSTGNSNGIICSTSSSFTNVTSYNVTLGSICSVIATSTTDCSNNIIAGCGNGAGNTGSITTGANTFNGNSIISCGRTTAGSYANLTGNLTRSTMIASQDSSINRGNNLVVLGCNGSSITVTSGQSSVMIGCSTGSITAGTYNGQYSTSGTTITATGSYNVSLGSSSGGISGTTNNTALIATSSTVITGGSRNVCIAAGAAGISSTTVNNAVMACNSSSVDGSASTNCAVIACATGGSAACSINARSSNAVVGCIGGCAVTGSTSDGNVVTGSLASIIAAGTSQAIIGSTTCLLTASTTNNAIVASALTSITATGGTASANLIAACNNSGAIAVVTGANTCTGNAWISCTSPSTITNLTGNLTNSFQAASRDSYLQQGSYSSILASNGSNIGVTSGIGSVIIGSLSSNITGGTYNGIYSTGVGSISSTGLHNTILSSATCTISGTSDTRCVIIGSNLSSMTAATKSSNVMIASDSITDTTISTNNTVFGGTASTVRWQIQSGTGNATFTGTLTAGGNAYPTTTGSAGQVLTSNGAGTVQWQNGPSSILGLNSLFMAPTNDTTSTISHTQVASGWFGSVLAPTGRIYNVPEAATIVSITDPSTNTVDTSSITGVSGGWRGGVLAPNGRIYMVPYSATTVGIINPYTNTVDVASITGLTGGWAGGVLAPNGKIYMVPQDPDTCSTPRFINPADNTTGAVTGAALTGLAQWIGGVLGRNGKIYCVPYQATDVLIIDTSNDTYALMGASLGAGSKWAGGVLGPNGLIYCVPADATTVLIINPNTDTAEVTSITGLGAGTDKWSGGCLSDQGLIYCAAASATTVLIIDPYTNTADITTITGLNAATGKYIGLVAAPNGKLYSTSFGGTANILCIDPIKLNPSNGYITAVADAGGGQITVTSNNHRLRVDSLVDITGTTDYDGILQIISVTANTFNATATFTSSQTGSWRRLYPQYNTLPQQYWLSAYVNKY